MICDCGAEIDDPYDVTIGGDGYGNRCCGTMDVPAIITCEKCGAEWCDGDRLATPPAPLNQWRDHDS